MELHDILEFARKAVPPTKDGATLSAPDPDWFREFVDAVMERLDYELHDDGAECPCCGIPT